MGRVVKENCINTKLLSEKICASPITGYLKYATRENFIGNIVDGYQAEAKNIFILEKKAAIALCEAQNYFHTNFGLDIVFHDGYRPLQAVQYFGRWTTAPYESEYELERKKIHYPTLEKKDISEQGFLATIVSRHCFGYAVDITLAEHKTGEELDFGCIFDYFGEESYAHVGPDLIGQKPYKNRQIFIEGMEKFGFKVFDKEFWHFEFDKVIDEPMNFPITPDLKSLGF